MTKKKKTKNKNKFIVLCAEISLSSLAYTGLDAHKHPMDPCL